MEGRKAERKKERKEGRKEGRERERRKGRKEKKKGKKEKEEREPCSLPAPQSPTPPKASKVLNLLSIKTVVRQQLFSLLREYTIQ